MRSRGDADAVRLGDCEGQPNPDPNAIPHPDSVGVGQPFGDRDRQRFGDTLPIAVGNEDAVSVADAQWQCETLGLALSQAPTRSSACL